MSWQGNHDILIDRFDVRAHLDYIPETKPSTEDDEEFSQDERYINYERYRILAQNDFLGVSEEKFLQQLAIEEQFGPVEKTEPQPIEGKKKVVGAAIGYNYGEGTVASSEPVQNEKESSSESDDEDEDEDSDIDFDLCVDVNKISSAQAHEMNASALAYGMVSNDFFSFLTKDVEEAENLKIAREREEEKAMFSGRKSRRERRAFREKKLMGRKLSPPSYAASKEAPIVDLIRTVSKSRSKSRSRSPSPPNAGMIQYITSFGGDEVPLEPPPPQTIKTSVHTSKEEANVYKRTVRYKSSRSPESSSRRLRSASPKGTHRYRSRSSMSSDDRRWSRSKSPQSTRSPECRRVRYHSRSSSPSYRQNNSRARSSKDYDRSSSTSYRKRQSLSRSRSPSPHRRVIKKSASPQPQRSIEVPAPPVITRYYGRHKNESSSSELDLSDSEDKSDKTSISSSNKNTQAVGNSGGRTKPAPSAASKLSLQERLKKKRQALINRQYKADKRAERLRQEKAEQERQDREDEMREISIKMRRRERQKRHQYYEMDDTNAAENSDDDDDRLSGSTSDSGSEKNDSDTERNTKSRAVRETKHPDKSRRSRERDTSRSRSSRRSSDSRKEGDYKRDRDRSEDRDRRARRSRDEERYRGRDRSRERLRDRSRDRERYRRERDHSRERGQGYSRERERYRQCSKEGDQDDESGYYASKKPIRPLVDY